MVDNLDIHHYVRIFYHTINLIQSPRELIGVLKNIAKVPTIKNIVIFELGIRAGYTNNNKREYLPTFKGVVDINLNRIRSTNFLMK